MASEKTAWGDVQKLAAQLTYVPGVLADHVRRELHALSVTMQTQLSRGLHENPPMLAVFSNPGPSAGGRRPAGRWSRRVYEVRYQHAEDGKDYKHTFEPGVSLKAGSNGSVTLYRPDGRTLWEDF